MGSADPFELRLAPSAPQWLDAVKADFDTFLRDHASCEKKASGMAMNIASHYPDKPDLLRAMMDLAVEELSHYREVVRLLLDRGSAPGADSRDAYVHAMNGLIRRGTDVYLFDRLLVAAVIEARGHERFALLAQQLEDESLRRFYRAISASEDRHWTLFCELAALYFPRDQIVSRLAELVRHEARIVADLPPRAALH
ncbi:MAG: tRNA-(ms[2]io[6]A)-hydroxylase [Pseudomonadota bacterium]